LIGGGHAHVTVIRALGMRPEPGVVVTVIAKELEAPYSGMLPGYVAGHYTYEQCHIDLVRLAMWAGVRLVHGVVTGIDRARRQVTIEGRPPLGYDLLSIDVGITPLLDGIEGAAEHALSVKPVSTFAARWNALESAAAQPEGPRDIVVVGSGAAGFEIILAARHRLIERCEGRSGRAPFRFTLIGTRLLPSHNSMARRLARKELAAQGVELIEGDRAVRVDAGQVILASGRAVRADRVMISTHAGPAPWFRTSGLPLDAGGFLAVRPTLQLVDDDDVFAAGDCATVLDHPREKAGVFAVRQGPPLTENLLRRSSGEAARPFTPQSSFLTLLSTGGKGAIAARNGVAASGAWVWRWKDRIDRDFMAMFADLPVMSDVEAGGDAMRCAGCAAKVGPVPLSRALARFGQAGDQRDDAAVIDDGGAELGLETIDFFRAFWPEPYLLGEIAAGHAMSDVLAMGGRPRHALANVVLPYARSHLVEEDLFQILAGARAAFAAEGAEIVGGHSGEGAELAVGFFVSGKVGRDALLRKGGLRPGDNLVLTRPLGSGILFAAGMRARVPGPAISRMLATMRQSNAPAVRTLVEHGAGSATDVTGFGLAGHLLEMLDASNVSARIGLSRLPLYDGVRASAEAGIASTLLPENARLASRLVGEAASQPAARAILFDPQTAGGILAGIPASNAERCVAELRALGITGAEIIGEVEVAQGAPTLRVEGTLR
jgi:selenide,water dikinase